MRPRQTKRLPRNAICSVAEPAEVSTNWGRKAKKKSAVFGFVTLTRTPWKKRRRRAEERRTRASISKPRVSSVRRPRKTRYAAPTYLTALNAVADERRSEESPSDAAATCTAEPTPPPRQAPT